MGDQIYTKETFSTMVEETKYRLRLSYLECIMYICAVEKIDEEYVPKLLTKQLKSKIEDEARKANLFKKVKMLDESC